MEYKILQEMAFVTVRKASIQFRSLLQQLIPLIRRYHRRQNVGFSIKWSPLVRSRSRFGAFLLFELLN